MIADDVHSEPVYACELRPGEPPLWLHADGSLKPLEDLAALKAFHNPTEGPSAIRGAAGYAGGRARAVTDPASVRAIPAPRDELQEQIDFIRWVMSGDALNAAVDEVIASDTELALEEQLFSHPSAGVDPMGDALERQRIANARLLHKDDDINPQAPSDWDMDGQGVVEVVEAVSNVPPEIAALLDEGETLTRDVRRKLTERLNVELAELKNLRGLAGEDLKREAEIEKLLGLFARLGEI